MRYYFDMRDGDELIIDEEGVEFSTIAAVRQEAVRSLADMARGRALEARHQSPLEEMMVEVRDNVGPVLKAKFSFELVRFDS